RAERNQRGRAVGGGSRYAALAGGGIPADRAVLLQAEVDRLAPLVALVVVVAARVETKIAAERAHVAQMHGGDLRGGLIKPRVALPHPGVGDDFVQREPSAQGHSRAIRDVLQRLNLAQRNQRRGRLVAALHVGKQIGAPGQQHRLRALRSEYRPRLVYRFRRAVTEPRQPHHEPRAFSGFRAGVLGGWLIELPSPPSHGGGTSMGSGYGTSGNATGPTRAMPPFAFFSSAASTLSGVIGSSSIRAPMASYTAFATAGITGSS